MEDKITYHINESIINPEYVGVITTPMDDDFVFEDFRQIPKTITQIDKHIRDREDLDYTVLDCRSKNAESSVRYSKIDCDDFSMVYLFFNIQCDTDTKITFSIESIAAQRLWINGELATLCCTVPKTRRQLFTFILRTGDNSICLEQHQSVKQIQTTVRITSFDYELSTDNPSLIKSNLHYKVGEIDASFVSNEVYDGEKLRLACVPVDMVNLDLDLPLLLSIEDSDSGECLYSQEVHFYEYITIDTSVIPYKKNSIFSHTHVAVRYRDVYQREHEHIFDLHLTVPDGYVVPTEERAKRLLSNESVSSNARKYITYQLTNIYRLAERDLRNFDAWEAFARTLDLIENELYEEYLESPGTKKRYYYSEIDDQNVEYIVCLPEGYSKEKTYALLIFNTITNAPESMFSHYFERSDQFSDCIVADIHGRGMTTGSYIGDISFREILNDILSNFPIDRNKIFAMGQSNGGFSTWVLAQKTPDVFAGICPSTGYFNPSELVNLSNIRTYYFTSDADPGHQYNTETINSHRDYLKDYKEITFHKLMHNVFEQVQFYEPVLMDLMKAERNAYPDEIYYHTYMNRYRRAYWIEIHSVSYGKLYAKVHAKIQDGNIYISAENLTGLTVNVPQQVNSDSASIIINGIENPIEGREVVYLTSGLDGFSVTDSIISTQPHYKGTGLLDVFLTPMRIINYASENRFYDDAAWQFRTPSTNTYTSFISVGYPIYTEESPELSSETLLQNNSFVVFDYESKESSLLNTIRNNLSIRCDRDGYEYEGKYYPGKYCIMQIIENPWNAERSILHICANDETLISKHIFLRHLIIPSYVSGFHPYLNVSALIFDGRKYSAIHDYGMKIEEIK